MGSNSMFSHLMGHKHRKEFAEKKGFRHYVSQKELLRFANRNSENSLPLTKLINTTTSDVAYPAWPAGKAPWSVEKGGNGVPPADLKAESQAEAEHMIAVGKQMVEMALKSQHS